jgi:16S rRNA (uracil1498-N3)-methyltransferase
MNLVLLNRADFFSSDRVRLTGRRLHHLLQVHRVVPGDELLVGVEGGEIGRGIVESLHDEAVDLVIALERDPPPPLPLTLILALPRPKVLNRVLITAVSMGCKRILLINCWKVEKSYWATPRLAPENLQHQSVLGLEQARDTVFPEIRLVRRFRPFVEDELPALASATNAMVAHPAATTSCPRSVAGQVTLAIGPEGGFIDNEIELFRRAGLEAVSLGPRPLRVEAIVPALIGRLF